MITLKEKLRVITDVAFNNNVRKIYKKSYSETIDVQLGVYEGDIYTGWATVNLKASNGWRDWLINLCAWGCEQHHGYQWEVKEYFDDLLHLGDCFPLFVEGMKHGIIVSGRSKGGAEAILVGEKLAMEYNILVGSIDGPRCVSSSFARKIENEVGKDNVVCTTYCNDIVPGIPFWFKRPGVQVQFGKRGLGLSIRDHIKATTDDDLLYEAIKKF